MTDARNGAGGSRIETVGGGGGPAGVGALASALETVAPVVRSAFSAVSNMVIIVSPPILPPDVRSQRTRWPRFACSSKIPLKRTSRKRKVRGIPGAKGRLWSDSVLRGHAKRGTGLLNNELYIGRLVWNRQRFMKNPNTGKRVARVNPPEEWILAEVPELRIVYDELWQAAKARQGELAEKYATAIAATQNARANRMNAAHRPRYLLSGLLECGARGGPYSMRGQGRYGCSNHVMTASCSNSRTIRRVEIEERIMAGLRDRLMAPEAAAEAMKAYAEETNRLNQERRASGVTDRKELAGVEKKYASMLDAIGEGGYLRGMSQQLRELEAR